MGDLRSYGRAGRLFGSLQRIFGPGEGSEARALLRPSSAVLRGSRSFRRHREAAQKKEVPALTRPKTAHPGRSGCGGGAEVGLVQRKGLVGPEWDEVDDRARALAAKLRWVPSVVRVRAGNVRMRALWVGCG